MQIVSLMDFRSHLLSKPDPGVEASAHSGAAGRQEVEAGQGGLNPLNPHPDLRHVASELLAEGQRGGVLSVGPPDLDDVIKLLRLGIKSIVELPEMRSIIG